MKTTANKFLPNKDKSVWSKLNKSYIQNLTQENLIHESGFDKIELKKKNGSWNSLDTVEDLVIPEDLELAFQQNKIAFNNYLNFKPSYRKRDLYWLKQAEK